MSRARELLEQLVTFPTISRTPNIELIDFVEQTLRTEGIDCHRVMSADGRNANLFAQVGPDDVPGIMLSGHTDVVPVEGQHWTVEPFALSEHEGRLYGRGTTDMKGFVACAIDALLQASRRKLKTPLQLALSYDEEIGCVGVQSLIDMLERAPFRTAYCLVGEPTRLVIATGHKGKTALRATCTGREVHSALAPTGLNAIHLATDLVAELRALADELASSGATDDDYDIPYSTVHVGLINGGIALNIVPNECTLDFEIRNLAEDSPEGLVASVEHRAAAIAEHYQRDFPEAAISIEVVNSYPGLNTAPDAEVVDFIRSLTGGNSTCKVAFGTEGGLFSERLGLATVVCGPGSMQQGHKPDEYITIEQLTRCQNMLDALLNHLSG